jgi:multidrug resistance efflux pump
MGIRDVVDAALNTSYGEAMAEPRERLTAQSHRFIVIYAGRWQATPRWLFWKPKWRRRVLELGARRVANYGWQYATRITIVNFRPQPEAPVSPPEMAELGSQTEAQPPLEMAAAELPAKVQLPPQTSAIESPADARRPLETAAVELPAEAQLPAERAAAELPAKVQLPPQASATESPADARRPLETAAVELPAEAQLPAERAAAEMPAKAQPPLETAAAELPTEALVLREATEAESRTEAQAPPETAAVGFSTEAAGAAPWQPPPSGAEPPEGKAGTQEAAAAPSPPTDQEQHEGEAGRREAMTTPPRPPPQEAAEKEARGGPAAAPAVPLQSPPCDAEPSESEVGRQEAAAPPLQPPHSAGHEPPEGEPRRQEAARASRIERLSAHRGFWRRRQEAAAPLPLSSLTGQEAPESEAAITGPSARPLIFREAAERGAGGDPEAPDAGPSPPPTHQGPREPEAGSQEAAAAPVPETEGAAGGPDAQPPSEAAVAGLPSRTQSPPDTSEADNLTVARSRAPPRRRPVLAVLFTAAAVALAVGLGWAMWDAYMGAPWTRDGTVRVYVVTMAPEVAGRIVELPVADNQFAHKGDLLMRIDPTDYKIAVSLAEAALQQAQANAQNSVIQAERRRKLTAMAAAEEEKQNFATNSQVGQAQFRQAEANLDQARVNLKRTEIRSPVNGWITNLLAQRGDYATVGVNKISVVDADSFWVDAYFEETNLGSIREGDQASVRLMGYNQIVRGHVSSIARGINVANAQPNGEGLATVNPIFTWVRLAQRIPVRIHVDNVPDGVRLAAGLTATVQIDSSRGSDRFSDWVQMLKREAARRLHF